MSNQSALSWIALPVEEASKMLFKLILDKFLGGQSYNVTACPNIRVLTQRLYGDYRQVHNTQEYKRAERHYKWYINTPLYKALS